MLKYPSFIVCSAATLLFFNPLMLIGEQPAQNGAAPSAQKASLAIASQPKQTPKESLKPAFEPFTGKITKNRVRLRLLPSLDGNIIKELDQNSMVVVVDETEDFYAVEPPADSKAYIFRTYIIDNVVEGTHVNVRLKPDMDAPVLFQLNSGDKVEGIIDPANNKWIEINLPKSVHFYIAKDYIQKIGDRSLMAKQEKRLTEVNKILNDTQMLGKEEMNKPFDQINLDGIAVNYQRIIQQYSDFPDQVSRAKESLDALQNAYYQKKLTYLEKHHELSADLKNKNDRLSAELKAQQNQLQKLKQQLQQATLAANQIPAEKPLQAADTVKPMPIKMAAWLPVEQAIYETSASNGTSMDAYYAQQKQNSIKMKGMLETYNRPVKNKPGDFILVNAQNNIPVAFLYSTQVNLQDWIGQDVTLIVSPRPNNNYAFPAYFVLGIE